MDKRFCNPCTYEQVIADCVGNISSWHLARVDIGATYRLFLRPGRRVQLEAYHGRKHTITAETRTSQVPRRDHYRLSVSY